MPTDPDSSMSIPSVLMSLSAACRWGSQHAGAVPGQRASHQQRRLRRQALVMIRTETLNLPQNTIPLEYSHVAPVFPSPPANVAALISGTPEVFICHKVPHHVT